MGLLTNTTNHPKILLARVTGDGADQMLAAYDPYNNRIIMNVTTLRELTDDGIIMCLNHELCHWAQTMFLSKEEVFKIKLHYNPDNHIMERAMPEEFTDISIMHFRSVYDAVKRMLSEQISLYN